MKVGLGSSLNAFALMSLWDLARAFLAPAVPSFYPREFHHTDHPFPAPFPRALCPRDGGAGQWRVATGGYRVTKAGGTRWLMQSRGADAVEPALSCCVFPGSGSPGD